MTHRSDLMRKVQIPVLFASMAMLPSLLVYGILAPEHMAFVWVLAIAYVLMACLCLLRPGRYRLMWAAGCGIVLLSLGTLMAWIAGNWWLAAAGLLFTILLFPCLPVAGWDWYEELPPQVYYLGIALFLSFRFVVKLISGELMGYSVILNGDYSYLTKLVEGSVTVSFLTFALLMLLSMNRTTLNNAMVRRHRASVNVRRKNRTMLLLFFLIVTVVVATPEILGAIWSFVLWILDLIRDLIALLRGEQEPVIPGGPLEPGGSGMGDLGGETTLFAEIMQKVFGVVSKIFFAISIPVLLVFLLGKVGKLLRKLKKLSEKMERFMSASSEDYVDEVTDIRDQENLKRLRSLKKGWLSPAGERKLPPGQRIRYRYGRLLRKHPEWAESHTAREKLPVETASLYEKARYSKANLTEEEAKQFLSDSKRI